MPKHHIALSENDIARIINGEEVHIEFKQHIKDGEKIIVRGSAEKKEKVDINTLKCWDSSGKTKETYRELAYTFKI